MFCMTNHTYINGKEKIIIRKKNNNKDKERKKKFKKF